MCIFFVTAPEEASSISLVEPDDCRRFHVTIKGLSEGAAQQIVANEEVGQLIDSSTAWIKISVIRKLAQERVQPDWSERFNAMLQHKG